MSDTPVFMLVNIKVTNPDEYKKYEKGFFPVLKKHGGDFVTFDDNSIHLEGSHTLTDRIVIFKFPSEDAAKAWYDDPEYQALAEHRRAGTELRFLTIVHSLPPRG